VPLVTFSRVPDPTTINKNPTLVTRALSLLLVCIAIAACTTPPVQEMSDARQAIMAAEDANAAKLAPEPLGDARRFLADAERQIQQEAYGPARMNAVRAKNRATQALRTIQAAADQNGR
jgi:F0F1-type ATP synthase membrane subunit b/b'